MWGRPGRWIAPPENDGGPVDRPHRPHPVLANPLKNNGGDDGGGGDDELRTQSGEEPACQRCGCPGSPVHGQLIRAHGGLFHPRCATEERAKGPWRGRTREVPPDRRPALGPPGDSLDDLK
jgi:hypothetical protein